MCYDGAAEKGDGLMSEWHRQIQMMIEEIDRSIRRQDDEALALKALAEKMGYSEYHLSRKFSEIAGISFREYLRGRRLAFALKQVRDTKDGLLEIALEFGFSSHEAFTRAFRENFGMAEGEITNIHTDVNGDDMVNIIDMGIFRRNFGKTAAKDCTVEYAA